MKIDNSQSKLGFGNLNITKFEKVGEETIKVVLGEIHTTKAFDKNFLNICKNSNLGEPFYLPEKSSQKLEKLVDTIITLPNWKGNHKMACYTGNEAQIIDKNAPKFGGYLISLKA